MRDLQLNPSDKLRYYNLNDAGNINFEKLQSRAAIISKKIDKIQAIILSCDSVLEIEIMSRH
jgi:hypothetical protein